MTTVLQERTSAPADPTDGTAEAEASAVPSSAAAPPAQGVPSVPAPRPPVARDTPAHAAPLLRLGPDLAALRATGVLDRPGVARLAAELAGAADQGAVHIDLDMSGVTHVDGRGARALLGQSYLLELRGGGLRLHQAPSRVRRALRFSGAGHLLHR